VSAHQYSWIARILHWLMAVMLLSMLFIGAAMVTSVDHYRWLVALHRPLGIAVLLLAIVRLVNRQLTTLPPFPATVLPFERRVVTASERLLYGLMFALPLVGWGMLSAARYPVVLFGDVRLPPILPHNPALYACLRWTHTLLAYLFFAVFLAHLSGVLLHAIVLRDGVLLRMVPWSARARARTQDE
jgi:cytochrome b561